MLMALLYVRDYKTKFDYKARTYDNVFCNLEFSTYVNRDLVNDDIFCLNFVLYFLMTRNISIRFQSSHRYQNKYVIFFIFGVQPFFSKQLWKPSWNENNNYWLRNATTRSTWMQNNKDQETESLYSYVTSNDTIDMCGMNMGFVSNSNNG